MDTVPGLLALSDDGKFLCVAQNGMGGVARVDTTANVVNLQFPLGTGSDQATGGWIVEDMAVMPGIPRTLGIARGGAYAGYNSGVAIYDDGVKRTVSLDRPLGTSFYRGEFVNPTNLYATSPAGFQILPISAAGVTDTPPITNNYAEDFAVASGLVFTTSGRVFDPVNLRQVGAFPVQGLPAPDLTN